MNKNIIYVNGIFSNEEEAYISPLNRGLMYGDGIFETFRGYGGKVFAVNEHFSRLQNSASFFKINVPFTATETTEIISELLEKNNLTDKDSRIRLSLIRGRAEGGLFPDTQAKSELIITAEAVSSGIAQIQQNGIKLILISDISIDSLSPLASHKTLNYMPAIVALMEVREKGGDEGIYLNHERNVVEGITSNIFIVKDGKLQTPPLSSGLLPGITRDTVIKCAIKSGIDVEELKLETKDLHSAEEIFITSSVREIVPVIAFEEKTFNIGAITQKMQASYKEFITKTLCRSKS